MDKFAICTRCGETVNAVTQFCDPCRMLIDPDLLQLEATAKQSRERERRDAWREFMAAAMSNPAIYTEWLAKADSDQTEENFAEYCEFHAGCALTSFDGQFPPEEPE